MVNEIRKLNKDQLSFVPIFTHQFLRTAFPRIMSDVVYCVGYFQVPVHCYEH